MAKQELEKMDLSYHSIELDIQSNCPNEDCSSLSKTLVLQTKIRTVPQIFIKGKFIGGYTDLKKLINDKIL